MQKKTNSIINIRHLQMLSYETVALTQFHTNTTKKGKKEKRKILHEVH